MDSLNAFLARQRLMKRKGLFQLRGDAFHRIERIARVLKHHRNSVAAKALPATVVHRQQIIAQHIKLASAHHAGLAHQAH
ncbi:hypothetical protein D3C85_1556630 [compost metagenome]